MWIDNRSRKIWQVFPNKNQTHMDDLTVLSFIVWVYRGEGLQEITGERLRLKSPSSFLEKTNKKIQLILGNVITLMANFQTELAPLPTLLSYEDFPGGSVVKNASANAGDGGFDPQVEKSPWRRRWQPTPVFLPG